MHRFIINPLKDPGAGIIELGMSRDNVRAMMSMLGEEEQFRIYDNEGREHIIKDLGHDHEEGEEDYKGDQNEYLQNEDNDDDEEYYQPPRYGYDFTIYYSQNLRVRDISFTDPEADNRPYEVYLFGHNVFKVPAQTLVECLIEHGGTLESEGSEGYIFKFPRSVRVFIEVEESEGNDPEYWPQITPGIPVATTIAIYGEDPDDNYKTDEEKGQLSLPI